MAFDSNPQLIRDLNYLDKLHAKTRNCNVRSIVASANDKHTLPHLPELPLSETHRFIFRIFCSIFNDELYLNERDVDPVLPAD